MIELRQDTKNVLLARLAHLRDPYLNGGTVVGLYGLIIRNTGSVEITLADLKTLLRIDGKFVEGKRVHATTTVSESGPMLLIERVGEPIVVLKNWIDIENAIAKPLAPNSELNCSSLFAFTVRQQAILAADLVKVVAVDGSGVAAETSFALSQQTKDMLVKDGSKVMIF